MKRRRMVGTKIKKGPWSAEEDEVLMKFVAKNGPRDWSSIQSNGLLPRTGKSCRLRWVNKLRPNLKVGCKFSAEEERIVVELQAILGNKWATIASHLQGRTDNDVKNFWSSRKKRLERSLLNSTSEPSNKRPCRKQKSALLPQLPSDLEVPESSNTVIQVAQPSSSANPFDSSSRPSNIETLSSFPESIYAVSGSPISTNPPLAGSALLPDSSWFIQQPNVAPSSSESSWNTLSYSTLPFIPDHCQIKDSCQVFAAEPTTCWQFPFPCTSSSDFETPFFGGSLVGSYSKSTTLGNLSNNPDGFFDDFPTDVFDSLYDLPSSLDALN